MYAYQLLVQRPGANSVGENMVPVRPGPDLELPTLPALKAQFMQDFGKLPEWMDVLSGKEYIGVEHEEVVEGVYFVADVEGSEDHQLPPVAERLAFQFNHGKN